MANIERVTRNFLLYGVLPAWIAPGLVDWYSHKRTHVEDTAGLPESIAHALMLAETGIPVTLGLFLEANAPMLALAWAGVVAHTATAYWDVWYTAPRREISPMEQHAHAFLEVLPITTAAFLSVLHWREFKTLLGLRLGSKRLRGKRRPLAPKYIASILALVTVGLVVPFAEELRRSTRAARQRRKDAAALKQQVTALAPPLPAVVDSSERPLLQMH